MTRRVILHVGSPKCGSTYLQRVCQQNRALLGRSGFDYPPAAGPHPGNAAQFLGTTAAMIEAAFGPGIHTLIHSHEDLFALGGAAEDVAAALHQAGVEVQVVAFLRPFSEFIFGDYSQFLKQKFPDYLAARSAYDGRAFEEFAVDRSRMINAAAWLTQWARRFPGQALILAPHRDVRRVLGEMTGLAEALDWEVRSDLTNPSLRMEDCDRIAAAINDRSVPAAAVRAGFKAAFHNTKRPDRGRTPERIRWVEALFARQNRILLEEFGFDNRPARLPDAAFDYPEAEDATE